jgi:hypothetical protein
MFFKKKILALILSALVFTLWACNSAEAMPVGTLLYRTSSDANLYGYNTEELVVVERGMIKNIYTGHVAIYVGQEEGVHYIVEAMPDGIIKIPAEHFLNSNNNEKLIGARIPKNISELQRVKIMEFSKRLANSSMSYDFSFKKQKGPNSGDWTCVGLTEKIYESANISNPLDLSGLEYDPHFYAIDITPDGFDSFNVFNEETGDYLSRYLEFSKIEAMKNTILPFPEILGFNAGREHNNDRYFFFPITQYWQDSLRDVIVDIDIESDFSDKDLRGKAPGLSMAFRWSFLNNPASSFKKIFEPIANFFSVGNSESDLITGGIKPVKGSENDHDKNNLLRGGSNISFDDRGVENFFSEYDQFILGDWQSSIKITEGEGLDYDDSFEDENEEGGQEESDSDEENNEEEDNSDGGDDSSNGDNGEGEHQSHQEEDFEYLELLISGVHATMNDDYIEIYNPSNQAIDLAEHDIRLYKTKTYPYPYLMMRIGHPDDGYYPGGTIINPGAKYLVARHLASDEIKSKAQAIVERPMFTFSGNAYTIYLSQGVVSSYNDERIIDQVGYGEATYYLSSPAPEIPENHFLVRKAQAGSKAEDMIFGGSHYYLGRSFNTNNNSFDFVLVDLSPEEEGEDEDDGHDEEEEEDHSSEDDGSSNNDDEGEDSNEENNEEEEDDGSDGGDDSSNEEDESDNDNETPSDDEEGEEDQEENQEEDFEYLELLISGIYTTMNDDYIEIYNPSNQAIDLAEHDIRLYKTKTYPYPYLMMRIGHPDDGYYPGGTIINPGAKYLVARHLASDEIKSKAQAIVERPMFTFSGNAYTIYLSQGVVSSYNDERIIDQVGYGEATYYLSSPAPEIPENHFLVRKAQAGSKAEDMIFGGSHYYLGRSFNTNNNSFDFVLVDLSPEEDSADEEDCDEEESDSDGSDPLMVSGYCIDPGLYLNDIIHLWHLDECQGNVSYDFVSGQEIFVNSIWQEGKFGCGLKQYYSDSSLSFDLDPSFDSNNFTLFFYYQNLFDSSRPSAIFRNSSSGEFFRIQLYHYHTDFFNFPGVGRRDNNLKWQLGSTWNLFSLVVNKNLNYWALYLNGVEVYRVDMASALFMEADRLSIRGDNSHNLMDEIVVFSRALNPSEISYIYQSDLVLNSNSCYPVEEDVPYLLNYWSFNEYAGGTVYDLVGSDHLSIDENTRIFDSNNNYVEVLSDDYSISADFSYPFFYKDISLSFWRKNKSASSNSVSSVNFWGDQKRILGLDLGPDDFYYYFNNFNFKLSDYDLLVPDDHEWHHIALSYNSYLLKLSLYINGELRYSWRQNWLQAYLIDKITIKAYNEGYYIDELGVWSGSLDVNQANYIYEQQKNIFID